MHLSSTLAALACIALTRAFVIPPGTTDGVYTVIERDGVEQHIQIARAEPSNITSTPEPAALVKRDTQLLCGCGLNMNAGHTDDAVNNLKGQLDRATSSNTYIQPGQAYYAISTDVVAFACNRDVSQGTRVTGSTYGGYLARITYACGKYIAGSDIETLQNNQRAIYGYMRYSNGLDFCKHSTDSSQSHC